MGKKLTFLVLDSETATIAQANEIAGGDGEAKKRIAIGMPLIYDIGWCVTTRAGEILKKKQFLVAEIFSVPSLYRTAYYAAKRPRYIEMLNRGETSVKSWDEIMKELVADMESVNAVGAFNSMFDFKKAIPFTELYIRKLYSADFENWMEFQIKRAERFANNEARNDKNPDFCPDIFQFRGREYPLFDLWGLAVTHLLDNVTYKSKCLEHGLLTASGTFFKSSAESTYQYLCDKYDFVESHTALDDAEIETFILSKIAKRAAIRPGIDFFPFRELGYTYDFVTRRKKPNPTEVEIVRDAIQVYVNAKIERDETSAYLTSLVNKLAFLDALLS